MLRTFFAIPVSVNPDLRDVLSDLAEVGPALRVMTESNLHITLSFLGETAEEKLPDIIRLAEPVIQDSDPDSLELAGLGAFPNIARPSVVFATVSDALWLKTLAENLTRVLKPLGIPEDTKRFRPHVTLGRVKGRAPRELSTYLRQQSERPLGTFNPPSVEFMSSELHPEGARHTMIYKVTFNGL